MKKLFVSILAVALSLSAMAASTAAARIKLVGSNTTYAVSTVTLNEDDARNSSYESGYDAESMMTQSNSFSVLIYAYVGTHPCEYVATDNLDGQAISFTTNMIDANYTLQFSNVSGRELKLYDVVTATTTTITEGESYAFSVDPSQVGQVEVLGRFIINYDPSVYVTSVTTNADGWASFAYTADVAPAYPAGLTAYKGALNTTDPDNMVVDLTAVSAIPAGAGVFVHGAANTTYYFSAAASAPALTGNQIVGCTAATDPAGITDAIYTLRNVGGTTALYQYVGSEDIPAGKAYLPIAISAGAPARIAIRVAQPTDVREVEATVKAEKFMEDGKIFIRRGDNIYNLQGQKVN